jgi:hypothetical protein
VAYDEGLVQRVRDEMSELAALGILNPDLRQGLEERIVGYPLISGLSSVACHAASRLGSAYDDRSDYDPSTSLIDSDPPHLAQLLQVPVECAARAAGELGYLLGPQGRRALIVICPAEAQDAGHGDDERVVGLSVG